MTQQEMEAYRRATEFEAPRNCKYRATAEAKAQAHNFAYFCSARMGLDQEAIHHDRHRKALIPGRDWDAWNKERALRWLNVEPKEK